MRDWTQPPFPSRDPFPILERLDLNVRGIDVHPSFYRKDCMDAAHVIREQAMELARLREQIRRESVPGTEYRG